MKSYNHMRVCFHFLYLLVIYRSVYFSTECIYSPNAYRGYARAFIKVGRLTPEMLSNLSLIVSLKKYYFCRF
jgi:hypothetical protein